MINQIDKLIKKLINNKSDVARVISMYNYLNLQSMIEDVDYTSPVSFMWEGNEHEEKGI